MLWVVPWAGSPGIPEANDISPETLDGARASISNTPPSQSGQVAQLVEQRTENPRVGISILPLATRFQEALDRGLFIGQVAGPRSGLKIRVSAVRFCPGPPSFCISGPRRPRIQQKRWPICLRVAAAAIRVATFTASVSTYSAGESPARASSNSSTSSSRL